MLQPSARLAASLSDLASLDTLVQLAHSHLFGARAVPLRTDPASGNAHHAHQECTVEVRG